MEAKPSNTAKQSMKCYDYMVCVEKKGKEHHYTLEQDNKTLFRFKHKDSPGLLNPTSKIVQGMMKKMSGNAKTKTEDGDLIDVPDTAITDKIMQCLTWLDELLIAYEENKDELKAEAMAEEQEQRLKELSEESDKFLEFLEENNATIYDFIFYISNWIAGGESKNITIGVLCHLSTCLGIRPIWFIALGPAGEGKSVIDDSASDIMPESVIKNGRVSEKGVHRKSMKFGSNYLDKCILKMGDLGGKKDIEKWSDTIDRYKELTTEGKCEIEVVGESIDEETGERDVISFIVEGFPSVSATSVNTEAFDDQIKSRAITVSPEAKDEDVKRFFKFNKGKYAEKRDYILEHELGMFKRYIEYIRAFYSDIEVINPYWECLEEWFHSSRYYKRSLGIYPSLVEAFTILNQDFREKVDNENRMYLVSSKEDNELIANLFNPNQGLSEPAIRLFNLLVKWFDEFDSRELANYQDGGTLRGCKTIFSVGEIRYKVGENKALSGLKLGDMLGTLFQHGLIQQVDKMKRGNNNIYALNHHEPLQHTNINFDKTKIEKYVHELEGIYDVSLAPVLKTIDQKNTENDGMNSDCDFKLPPWVPYCQSSVKVVSSSVKNQKLVTSSVKKCQKNEEIGVTNHDKSKLMEGVKEKWGAFI